jgi:hypothetical protein
LIAKKRRHEAIALLWSEMIKHNHESIDDIVNMTIIIGGLLDLLVDIGAYLAEKWKFW